MTKENNDHQKNIEESGGTKDGRFLYAVKVMLGRPPVEIDSMNGPPPIIENYKPSAIHGIKIVDNGYLISAKASEDKK